MRGKKKLLLGLGVVVLDLASKYLVKKFLFLPVIENPGFNIFAVLAALAVFLILGWRYLFLDHNPAFVLIISGAAANLLDRLDDGRVSDFINLGISTMNLADLAIMIGILMICFKKFIQPPSLVSPPQ